MMVLSFFCRFFLPYFMTKSTVMGFITAGEKNPGARPGFVKVRRL
jgi:hypothetical protein